MSTLNPDSNAEVTRLEDLWEGSFGDEYVDRNSAAAEGRGPFWSEVLGKIDCQSVLEVGCNLGGNLAWIAGHVDPRRVFGVDINEEALRRLRTTVPEVNAVWSRARELPFRDRQFDLTFTTGVLIHQPVETLPLVMSEIVRCSRRYVLCAEYHADELTEVPYRGHSGALWKRDFGGYYQELFPELSLLDHGFLARSDDSSWDDVTYWLFEKTRLDGS